MFSQKIDVIIPAYNAQKTILRTIASILTQDIVDDLEVTIVNDGDEIGYVEIVKIFSPYLSIREIKLNENQGPGAARQFGIENTKNPLITFIDADDTFAGAFSLKTLRQNLLNDPKVVCCWSSFLEDQKDVYVKHSLDTTWMFGKLYKRSFIDKYNIHFPPNSRSNEDGAFNTLCRLYMNDNENINMIEDVTYYWHYKEDSITRVNNAEYSYKDSFSGYTENQIWAIKEAEKIVPFNGEVMKQKVMVLCNLYEYYLETKRSDPRYEERNWGYCKLFYKEIYREIKYKISEKVLSDVYNSVMYNAYLSQRMNGIMPKLGFLEFLEKLEQECIEEDSHKL
jgi:glycosyltransferase involved in cell wall biosynthesis